MIAEELRELEYTLTGKKALVVGLGSSGLVAARFLSAHGAIVTATDKRNGDDITGVEGLEDMGVGLEFGGHKEESFTSADLIVLSPGVPPANLPLAKAMAKGAEVVSDIELFGRCAKVPIVAVTGTNGKSTTTALLGEVLKAAGREVFVGGNIGRPVLEYFDDYGDGKDDADCAVLEVSSYHLERVDSFRPKVAVLLNITEDHLERYKDFADYAGTKLRAFGRQEASDCAVINVADRVIVDGLRDLSLEGRGLKGRVIGFSSEGPLEDGFYLDRKDGADFIVRTCDGDRKEYPLAGVGIKGTHNAENIMAAMAAAEALGVDAGTVIKVAGSFTGLAHRTEFVRELDGVSYINDSKSTNAGSLYKALCGMEAPVVLIAGGRDKQGDYGFLKELVGEKVTAMVVIGEASARLKEAFTDVTKVLEAESLEEAVGLAKGEAEKGTVLFSPACSSFDMFRNFEERGDRFRELVEAL